MKKFTITIEETVSDNFEVEAETVEEAMRIAEEKYYNCEIVLEPGNIESKKMAVMSTINELTEWIEF